MNKCSPAAVSVVPSRPNAHFIVHRRLKRARGRRWCVRIAGVALAALLLSFGAGRDVFAGASPVDAHDTARVSLHGPFIGSVGSQVVFTVHGLHYMTVREASGALVELTAQTEQAHVAARVEYTVIAADPSTGRHRIRVRTYPVDPDTLRASGDKGWEVVYDIGPEAVIRLEGTPIPRSYEELIHPDWFINWSMTRPEDLPPEPIAPGAEWASVSNFPRRPGYATENGLTVVGSFVEWLDVDGLGPVAHITESGLGWAPFAGPTPEHTTPVGEAFFEAEHTFVISPDEFAAYAERFAGVTLWIEADPLSPAGEDGAKEGVATPSESGQAVVEMGFYVEYDQDPSGSFPWPPYAGMAPLKYPTVFPGVPVTDALGPLSETLLDGTYVDTYVFHGEAGDRLVLRLESDEFDPYLILIDRVGEELASDDDSGGDFNALIHAVLPYTGMYEVWVNSWWPGEAGGYTLSLEFREASADPGDRLLHLGVPVVGTLGPWSETLEDGTYLDVYIFEGEAGQRISLRLESNDFDPYVFLADDTGSPFASDDDSGGDLHALLRTTLPYTGSYEVWVNTWASGERGDYVLSLNALEPFDMEGYAPVFPGEPVTGMLGAWSATADNGAYMAPYRFEAEAGQRISLSLQSDDFDAYVYLVDHEGNILALDDDGGDGFDALLRATLPYSGTYGVWVSTWDEGELGMYTLVLEQLGPFDLDEALGTLARLRHPDSLTVEDLSFIEWTLGELTEFVWELWFDMIWDEE